MLKISWIYSSKMHFSGKKKDKKTTILYTWLVKDEPPFCIEKINFQPNIVYTVQW